MLSKMRYHTYITLNNIRFLRATFINQNNKIFTFNLKKYKINDENKIFIICILTQRKLNFF